MVKNSLTSLLLLVFFPVVTTAQTFTNDQYGYSIEIDDGFELARNDDVTYFRSKDNDNVVIIKNRSGLNDDTARDYLQRGYQNEQIAIVAVSQPEEINVENGKGLVVDIQAIIERKLMKGVAGSYIGDDGQGIVLVVSAAVEDWQELASSAQEVMASIKFIKGRAGPDARDWYYLLAGTRLSLREKLNDKSKKEYLSFCSDGDFRHRISASSISESDSGSAMGHSTRTRSGLWRVVDDDGKTRLLLNYDDGRNVSVIIEDRNGQILLDGRRYHRLRKHMCR